MKEQEFNWRRALAIATGAGMTLLCTMLMKLPWTFWDAIIVALFGIPGTIVIAICRALF